MSKQLLVKKLSSIKKSKKIVGSLECIALHRTRSGMQALINSRKYLSIQSDMLACVPKLISVNPVASLYDIILMGNQSGLCFSISDGLLKRLLKELKKRGTGVRLWVSGQNFFSKKHHKLQTLGLAELHYIPKQGLRDFVTPWVTDWLNGTISKLYLIYPKFHNIYRHEIVTKDVLATQPNHNSEIEVLPDMPLNQAQALELYLIAVLHNAYHEANLAECAVKGISMKVAKDNADDLMQKYNIKIRTVTQGLITQELNELMIGN